MIVLGVDDGVLPLKRLAHITKADAFAEEVRLLYVAMTRARKSLALVQCADGSSSLIRAIPEHLLVGWQRGDDLPRPIGGLDAP